MLFLVAGVYLCVCVCVYVHVYVNVCLRIFDNFLKDRTRYD